MGYTWTDGELITATKLNNTGGGAVIIQHDEISDYSYSQIVSYAEAGNIVMVFDDARDGSGIGECFVYYLCLFSYDDSDGDFYSCSFASGDSYIIAIATSADGALTWD